MKHPVSSIDGLPVRSSGPWAQEKLTYLAKYMSIFNVGMKKRWRRSYLDLMAGPGRCIEEGPGVEFDGSPLVALASPEPFSDLTFVEGDAALADALRQRVGDRGTVIEGDCNSDAVIAQLRTQLGYGTLGLAFVDNLGLDVPLRTLTELSESRKVDLFITFQVQDMKRNLKSALDGPDEARWTRFFGAGWQDVALQAYRDNLSAEETTTRLLEFYGKQLRAIGYEAVAHSQQVMKNSRQVGLYRILLAGKDPLAATFFEKISKIEPSGQRRML